MNVFRRIWQLFLWLLLLTPLRCLVPGRRAGGTGRPDENGTPFVPVNSMDDDSNDGGNGSGSDSDNSDSSNDPGNIGLGDPSRCKTPEELLCDSPSMSGAGPYRENDGHRFKGSLSSVSATTPSAADEACADTAPGASVAMCSQSIRNRGPSTPASAAAAEQRQQQQQQQQQSPDPSMSVFSSLKYV